MNIKSNRHALLFICLRPLGLILALLPFLSCTVVVESLVIGCEIDAMIDDEIIVCTRSHCLDDDYYISFDNSHSGVIGLKHPIVSVLDFKIYPSDYGVINDYHATVEDGGKSIHFEFSSPISQTPEVIRGFWFMVNLE